MKAYSNDLRERILKDCDGGMSTRIVATKYDVSESWVRRLKQRRRETGETTPRRSGSPVAPRWLAHVERIEQLIAAEPDLTLQEMCDRLQLGISPKTLWEALRRIQITFKKKCCTPRSKIGPTFKRGASNGKPR
jgi:transposase